MNDKMRELCHCAGFVGDNLDNTVIGASQETALKNLIELVAEDCAEYCSDMDGGECMFSRGIRARYGIN